MSGSVACERVDHPDGHLPGRGGGHLDRERHEVSRKTRNGPPLIKMILHILEAEVCGPHSLRLTFSDGTRKRVNLLPLLDGPIFEPLRDPAYFARVAIDPVAGTVVWPNEADFAPEALYELQAEEEPTPSDVSEPDSVVAVMV